MRSWITRPIGAVLVAAAIAVTAAGGIVVSNNTPPPAPTMTPTPTATPGAGLANLWVDKDGGSCQRSASPVPYNDATACRPFATRGATDQLAVTNAVSGDTIMVKDQPGSDDYSNLILAPTAKTITIKAETAGIEFARSDIACSECTVEGLTFEFRGPGTTADDDWVCQGPPPAGRGKNSFFVGGTVNVCATPILRNVQIDGLRNHGTTGACPKNGLELSADDAGLTDETILPGTGFQFIGGSIHGIYNAKGINGGGDDVLISGLRFTDFGRFTDCDPDVHNECVYSTYMANSTFRNNTFEGCPSGQGIALLGNCSGGWGGMTIEGNVFARTNEGSGPDQRNDWHPSGGGRSLFLGSSICTINNSWTIRYNDFETGPDLDAGGTLTAGPTKGQVYGNLGAMDCNTALWAYHHNAGVTCGGANSVAFTPNANSPLTPNAMGFCYRDSFNWDFHLVTGCPAIGAGDPANVAPPDRDGNVRDANGPPAAGAYAYVP